jgi:hypothetical protein
LHKRRLVMIEQHPVHTAKGGVERVRCYVGQGGASAERIVSDAGDATPKVDVG